MAIRRNRARQFPEVFRARRMRAQTRPDDSETRATWLSSLRAQFTAAATTCPVGLYAMLFICLHGYVFILAL